MISRIDVAELKKNIANPGDCTIRRMAGAYVGDQGEIWLSFQKNFQSIDDTEYYKYMKLVKDIFQPGAMEDKNIELVFRHPADMPANFRALADTGLKDTVHLQDTYDKLIEHYPSEGNYLILLFQGVFDVMTKTSDGNELDESEEVYTYILGAICPVKLDKAALKYDEIEKSIRPKVLQHVVQPPAAGFVWPAFEARQSNPEKILFYCRHPQKPPHGLMELALQCRRKQTATEHRGHFENMVHNAVLHAGGEDLADTIIEKANAVFSEMLASENYFGDPERDKRITDLELRDILNKAGIPEIAAQNVEKAFAKEYAGADSEWPKIKWLHNPKMSALARAHANRQKIRNLLSRARNMAEGIGNRDFAEELSDYLEGTR